MYVENKLVVVYEQTLRLSSLTKEGFRNKFRLYKHQSFAEVQFISNCRPFTYPYCLQLQAKLTIYWPLSILTHVFRLVGNSLMLAISMRFSNTLKYKISIKTQQFIT
jgi:hypothetical protein